MGCPRRAGPFVRKGYRFNARLLVALMAVMGAPSLYGTLRMFLLNGVGPAAMTVAAQLEWFELIDEVLTAFFIIPLYSVLLDGTHDWRVRFTRVALSFMVLYGALAAIQVLLAPQLVAWMAVVPEVRATTVAYVQGLALAFIPGFAVQLLLVFLVIRERSRLFYWMLALDVLGKTGLDLLLIPQLGVLGIPISNGVVSTLVAALVLCILVRDGSLRWRGMGFAWWSDAVGKGRFAGAQMLLDNLVYMLLVVRMMNELRSAGDYWVASSFIWGWLLLPVLALGEIVKKDAARGAGRQALHSALAVIGITVLLWLVSAPLWPLLFATLFNAPSVAGVQTIVWGLVAFYVAYLFGHVADNVLYGLGQTGKPFYVSMLVNLLYYPAAWVILVYGRVSPSVGIVIVLFGVGMLLHASLSFWLANRALWRQRPGPARVRA